MTQQIRMTATHKPRVRKATYTKKSLPSKSELRYNVFVSLGNGAVTSLDFKYKHQARRAMSLLTSVDIHVLNRLLVWRKDHEISQSMFLRTLTKQATTQILKGV